ncbi:hypothetical protein FDT66_11355 [Polaribacter aestuariivivens]|uniref:Uncharacterized protein n=1 Tax=Polaribacter aestuariivivens TaxID=2304626 RepID=A0A5S3N1U0_9FLAO|nr:hypothetical protein [Polaribacter aestuariivivens]TMM28977.1 hypothetical protein FDT66_11355 [Polaribacter aestuariivivens]
MKLSFTKIIIFIFLSIIFTSCGDKSAKVKDHKKIEFFKEVENLKEFKIAEKRIDSLKSEGIDAEISISILKESFYKEDTLKNISLAFINEGLDYSSNILYTIKFNRDTYKILSVIPN